jgi:hypothetical protein
VTPPTCGLVLAPRRLVAVVHKLNGEARRAIRVTLTGDARYGLVAYLAAAGTEVVAAESLVRADPVARQLLAAGLTVWVAPHALVTASASAAAITTPTRLAAMLARLPRIPLYRAQLRRLTVATESRQGTLL